VFVQSFVLMIGGFIGPVIRKITPRAALLGTLAGVSITFISMRPALQMFMTPVIGVVCFAIILVSWFGGVRYFGAFRRAWWRSPSAPSSPGARRSVRPGLRRDEPGASPTPSRTSASRCRSRRSTMCSPASNILGVILVTAIPFGIYDLVEAMDNVESAAAAGDSFPTTRVLTADGVISLIGCLMGNPFINAVYIGHPGWKAMGGRIGYSAATGIMVIVL
jgi:adenine/guanine/hypoxanthine permease